jgi:hypothetical protein
MGNVLLKLLVACNKFASNLQIAFEKPFDTNGFKDLHRGSTPPISTKKKNPVAAMVTGFFLCFQGFAGFCGTTRFLIELRKSIFTCNILSQNCK